MDGAVDAAAAQQRAVGRVDDRVHVERGDVGDDDIEQRLADFGGEQGCGRGLMPGRLSRPLGLDLGLQIDGAAHADVVEMRVEKAPRRALAVLAQHLEEVVVGVEAAVRR